MENKVNRYHYKPDFSVPPGATLQETITHLGIKPRDLTKRTGLATQKLNRIIEGNEPLTQQTAVLLERVTNVPANVWNNLEADYREQLARLQSRT